MLQITNDQGQGPFTYRIVLSSKVMKTTQWLIALSFLLTLTPALIAEQTASPPNILFIFADDVGQEVLECYGGQSYPTPHLNELARYWNEVQSRLQHARLSSVAIDFDVRPVSFSTW